MRFDNYESVNDLTDIPRAWETGNNHTLPHFHEGIELVYVVEGSFTGTVNNHPIRVNEGELLVNDSYAVHAYDDVPCKSIVMIIPLNAVPSLTEVLTKKRFRDIIVKDPDSKPLLHILKLIQEFDGNILMKRGLSYALLGYLIDTVGMMEFGDSSVSSFLKDVLTYLSQHFREQLSLEQLATRFGYSTQRFNSLFREAIGYTLPKYVSLMRIRHAARQLTTTDKSVSEIAMECGFANARLMDQNFREEFGMSPAEYVRAHKTYHLK